MESNRKSTNPHKSWGPVVGLGILLFIPGLATLIFLSKTQSVDPDSQDWMIASVRSRIDSQIQIGFGPSLQSIGVGSIAAFGKNLAQTKTDGLPAGLFIVGTDIAPGLYTITPNEKQTTNLIIRRDGVLITDEILSTKKSSQTEFRLQKGDQVEITLISQSDQLKTVVYKDIFGVRGATLDSRGDLEIGLAGRKESRHVLTIDSVRYVYLDDNDSCDESYQWREASEADSFKTLPEDTQFKFYEDGALVPVFGSVKISWKSGDDLKSARAVCAQFTNTSSEKGYIKYIKLADSDSSENAPPEEVMSNLTQTSESSADGSPVATNQVDNPNQSSPGLPVVPDVEYRKLNGNQFNQLFDQARLPNLRRTSSLPYIFGDPVIDDKIRNIALNRGYQLRRQVLDVNRLVKVGKFRLQPEAAKAYLDLKAAAAAAGFDINIKSGYRSVATQRYIFLKNMSDPYTDQKIDKVLSRISIPGYSKHHTGYAIDLRKGDESLGLFAHSKGYAWLSKDNYLNAKKYGWIPSYPPDADNQGPNPEPWEFTFIGRQSLILD